MPHWLKWPFRLALGLLNWLPGTALACVVALAWLVWWWSGQAGSLQQATQLARTVVPALHGLDVQAPQATLRQGGRIDSLRWHHQGLTVEAQEANVQWAWPSWQQSRQSPVTLTADVQTIQVDDRSPSRPGPTTPPDDFTLPWPLQAQVHIHRLQLKQQPLPPIQDVHWQHHYQTGMVGDGLHTVAVQATMEADSSTVHYTLNARLQDAGSMHLQATLQANAQGQRHGIPWQGTLSGDLLGPLAGRQATLQTTLQAEWTGTSPPSRSTARLPTPPQITLQAALQPWHPQPVHELAATLHDLNLATWLPGLPRTAIRGQATVRPLATTHASPPPSPADQWQGVVDLTNPASGPWNQGQLPVARLQATAQGNIQGGELQQLNLQLASGNLNGQGRWNNPTRSDESPASAPAPAPTFTGALEWRGVQASALHTQLPPWVGSGRLTAAPNNGQTQWQGALEWGVSPEYSNSKLSSPVKRQASVSFDILDQPQGYLIRQAQLTIDNDWLLQAQGTAIPPKHPSAPPTTTPPWQLTGQAKLSAPGLLASVEAPQATRGSVDVQVTDLSRLEQAATPWLKLLESVQTNAPATPGLVNAWQGQAHLQAEWSQAADTPPNAASPFTLSGKLTVPSASTKGPAAQPAWHVQDLTALVSGTTRDVRAQISGQVSRHQLLARLQTQLQVETPSPTARPVSGNAPLAHIRIPNLQLQLASSPQQPQPVALLSLTDPVHAVVQADGWQLDPGTLEWSAMGLQTPSAPARFAWQTSTYRAPSIRTQGEWHNLNLPVLQSLQQVAQAARETTLQSTPTAPPQLLGDLTLQGQWHADWPLTGPSTPTQSLQFKLFRTAGDLSLPVGDGTQTRAALGIQDLQFTLSGQANQLALQTQWTSQRLGKLRAQFQSTLESGLNLHAHSSLMGRVDWTDTNLALWSALAPPGWRMGGLASLQANLAGTLGQPDWQGNLHVRQLSLRSVAEGLAYENGELAAQLTGQRMTIQRFRLEGEGGQSRGGAVEVLGHIDWPDFNHPPSMQLEVQASGLNASTRADRRLTLSGQAQMGVQQGVARLRGNLKADQARFRLPDETAPTQGSDVVVRMTREAAKPTDATPGLRTDVDVLIELGPDFALEGLGVDTRLKGKLRIVSPPASASFSVTGEVQTVQGTYRAYGQRLNISQGILRFSGPYDDPTLDILALRTIRKAFDTSADPAQEVGVRMAGSARQPVLRLYAKPDLPDADKLAFLVLGRSASGAGAEAALLQQAAVALLAGSGPGMDATLARTLGLDDVSFQSQTGTSNTENNASLLLGKRLSDRLYVAYEHSLSGSVSAISLFYDLSRRLTLRARAGQTQALDLIATVPHD